MSQENQDVIFVVDLSCQSHHFAGVVDLILAIDQDINPAEFAVMCRFLQFISEI